MPLDRTRACRGCNDHEVNRTMVSTYLVLADALKAVGRERDTRLLVGLADALERDNPRFNRGRWIDYIQGRCGPSGGKRAVCA